MDGFSESVHLDFILQVVLLCVMLHADQDGRELQALVRLVIELLERVKIVKL